jgi:outer membrane protein
MRILTFVAALAFLAPSASANELLRLYDLAVQNDTQLRAAEGARDAARAGVPQSFGALLPQLNARATGGKLEVTTTTQTTPPFTSSSDTDSSDLTLNLQQALFDAAAWNRWQNSEALARAADASYRLAEQGLALRLAEAYFNVLAAADTVRFADAEKQAVERSLELARKRFEVGLSAITDVQEAQARYDLTVAQMIEAEQALSNARVAVTEITNAADTRVAPLREDIPLLGPTPDDVNEWLKAAADNSLEVRLARAQAAAARENVDLARAGHYPKLSLVGTQSDGTQSQFTGAGTVDTEYDRTYVGLQLDVPIFAGLSTQAGVNVAQGTYRQRLAELEGRKRSVERTTRNAYQGVIAGVARVKALKQAVVSNTTALEASEVGLEVGARTAVDVLNAQRELFRAQRDYSRSRYDYLLNILRLKAAAGQLQRKDLNEVDALLGAEAAGTAG